MANALLAKATVAITLNTEIFKADFIGSSPFKLKAKNSNPAITKDIAQNLPLTNATSVPLK